MDMSQFQNMDMSQMQTQLQTYFKNYPNEHKQFLKIQNFTTMTLLGSFIKSELK